VVVANVVTLAAEAEIFDFFDQFPRKLYFHAFFDCHNHLAANWSRGCKQVTPTLHSPWQQNLLPQS
jgi:hypothetical protein